MLVTTKLPILPHLLAVPSRPTQPIDFTGCSTHRLARYDKYYEAPDCSLQEVKHVLDTTTVAVRI